MNSANIENDCHTGRLTAAVYETLTEEERVRLDELTIRHGTLRAACDLCACNPLTIRRAIAGMRIKPETASKFRDFLNS